MIMSKCTQIVFAYLGSKPWELPSGNTFEYVVLNSQLVTVRQEELEKVMSIFTAFDNALVSSPKRL